MLSRCLLAEGIIVCYAESYRYVLPELNPDDVSRERPIVTTSGAAVVGVFQDSGLPSWLFNLEAPRIPVWLQLVDERLWSYGHISRDYVVVALEQEQADAVWSGSMPCYDGNRVLGWTSVKEHLDF